MNEFIICCLVAVHLGALCECSQIFAVFGIVILFESTNNINDWYTTRREKTTHNPSNNTWYCVYVHKYGFLQLVRIHNYNIVKSHHKEKKDKRKYNGHPYNYLLLYLHKSNFSLPFFLPGYLVLSTLYVEFVCYNVYSVWTYFDWLLFLASINLQQFFSR